MSIRRLALAAVAAACISVAAEDPADPWIDRIEPLGGQRGTQTDVTLVGKNLAIPAVLEFDSPYLSWATVGLGDDGSLSGRIRVSPDAPPGPHIATLATPAGRSNSRMFYVDEFPSSREIEPNDTPAQAQGITLEAQTLHGAMHELADIDVFAFEAGAGQRWTFDLRSLEYGGFLENDMALLDSNGARVAFNDDRDDYLETPYLEHVFERPGKYYLKLDQYRGPQRVNCARNCGYMLRIGQLPRVEAAFPLGARPGSRVDVSLRGRALADVESVWLVPVRRAEYYRLTFPFTVPLRVDQPPEGRIVGDIVQREDRRLAVRFDVPNDAWRGLWRLWARSPGGVTDSVSLEVSDTSETDCREIRPSPEGAVCDSVLESGTAEHAYWIALRAGQPLVATTLAAQLGLPYVDTVLELFDGDGNLVAQHDDLMTGQGTVIGNPDSMLYYKPETAGRYRLVVRDRIGRFGPDMAYRLRLEEREPGFALLSDPENLNVRAGATERVGVLLTPEPGFERAVDTWIEDPPAGISATLGRFRAGQFFGPSGDGDNIVIPATFLEVRVDADLPPGDYPLRIVGRPAGGGNTVDAISTLWIGPPRKRNDVRRPLQSIRLTVMAASSDPGASGEAALSGGSR
jgi:hypothetical protein